MAEILICPDSIADGGDGLKLHGGTVKMSRFVKLLSELPTNLFNGFRLYADFGTGSIHEDGGTRLVTSRMLNFIGETPETAGMSCLFKWRNHVLMRLAGVSNVFAKVKAFEEDGDVIRYWIKRNQYHRVMFDRSEFFERLHNFCLESTQDALDKRNRRKENG